MSSDKLEIIQLREENKRLFNELKRRKAKLSAALKELEDKNKASETHLKELSDSVNYAKRIQRAILAPRYIVNKYLRDNFIVYIPKDVISGDFYYIGKVKNEVVFAAVDCTGHGVPGALMSVVGFNYLEQAVKQNGITKPTDILSFLDEGVNDMLRQTAGESGVADGMDLGICTLNFKTRKLQFAGAYNPVYITKASHEISILMERDKDNSPPVHDDESLPGRSREARKMGGGACIAPGKKITVTNLPSNTIGKYSLYEIKADKLPIGVNLDGVVDIYTNHTIKLEKGDTVYLLSDGYADQFGGPHQKKFMYQQLRDLLCSIHDEPMLKQKRILVKTFNHWKGDNDQIDDVLIIGVRV